MKEVLDRRGKPRVQTSFEGQPSLTDQSDMEMTHIHKIMERFGVTGIIDHLAKVDDMFLDVTELPEDYQAVCEYVNLAEEKFMRLPSKVRELFEHDVAKWLDAAHDQEKRDAILDAAPSELGKAKIEVPEELKGSPETPPPEAAG